MTVICKFFERRKDKKSRLERAMITVYYDWVGFNTRSYQKSRCCFVIITFVCQGYNYYIGQQNLLTITSMTSVSFFIP